MTSNQTKHWQRTLQGFHKEGRGDAEMGIHKVPYPASRDPEDQACNLHYKLGWEERRAELGERFRGRG